MTDEQIRKSMTSEQIQLERKLTCEAIDGAMAFGYQNMNVPPSDDHWLTPYWNIGRKQAELELLSASKSAAPDGWGHVAIANELWQLAECGYEHFRNALANHIKKAYQDGWDDRKNGIVSVTYGDLK
ncbi:hypothetical protein FVF58_09310 [Paraburkholderia panacisoli]|uniref:Uncharacterized protein n=1 Tax=Paraburkholderia panacisoli TaxID=2603818 RepID=A0A5B0HCY6_9BURK|nr:hypothetical protein [Paraburkholderia panacisoli]KAA1012982.1 hypothetical protein FVF58_09310 [Paraburkholderia panacisoli]